MENLLRISDRLAGIAESSTLKMSAMAKELASKGVKVYNFAAGEPDFPVPANINKSCIEAVEKGFNKYTPVPGIPELRAKIAEKLLRENGLAYKPDQIIVSSGAKQSIFNFLLAVINSGDEVIIPSPYWVSYPEMVKIAGGNPVVVTTSVADGFKMSVAQLKKVITPRTRVLILNSPSNPAGVVYSKKEMQEIAKLLEGTNILVLSDEIYEKLIYSGEFCSFGALSEDAFHRTVTINGFSKAFSMTGWRLGYAAGPKPIIGAMNILQGQSTSGASSIIQKAALTALDLRDADFQPMIAAFKKRRAKMEEIFSRCKYLSYFSPSGAFYFFLNVEKVLGVQYNHDEIIGTSDDLALYLLNVANVSTVAGSAFGHEEYLRLSFAVSDQDVEQGSVRIVEAIEKLMTQKN